MLHLLSRICLLAALGGLLGAPTVAWGQDHRVRHVQDDAGLFTQPARDKADAIITQIADRHHKELFIETVAKGPVDAKERADWSKTRFNNYKMDGVYVVFSREPKFFRIEVGDKTRSKGYFGVEDVRKLEEIIRAKQPADEMLVRIADYTLDTMNRHPVQKGRAELPAAGQRAPAVDATPPWLGWVCMIAGGLLVVWVIFAIIRAVTGMMGGYGGGYPGYGYGGGGFFTGLLGGMFGTMAGMWMYNNFFGGHANYNTGDWGGGSDASATGAGYDGDTGIGASGGGDDWGGGDAGGGDAGGGDWGGGDVGGGDVGGGDAGCGGGGCGGGCGGGGD